MENAWEVMGFSYLLSAVVAMVVAALIHLLVKLIRCFGNRPAPVEIPAEDIEIAIAIAAALRQNKR